MAKAPLQQNWRVHVGAHKTATTHVQRVLDALADSFPQDELKIIRTEPNRAIARSASNRGKRLKWLARTLSLRFSGVPALRKQGGGSPVVAYSEEAILGWPKQLFMREFYPRLSGLDLLEQVARKGSLDLFVSVRRYDTLLVSAFFELLKVDPDALEVFERARTRMMEDHEGWPGLLNRISRRLPEARIHFWCQEDYSRDPRPMLSGLLGRELKVLPEISRPERTRSPALEAIDEVAKLDTRLTPRERHTRVVEIYSRYPVDEGTKPRLFSDEEVVQLGQRYDSHLEVLRSRWHELGLA